MVAAVMLTLALNVNVAGCTPMDFAVVVPRTCEDEGADELRAAAGSR